MIRTFNSKSPHFFIKYLLFYHIFIILYIIYFEYVNMRNIIITLVLIFIHSINLNVFWYDNSNYKPWEIIVEYNSPKLLNNEINDSSCSYDQQSKKILEENWLSIKESLWNIALISFDTNRNIEEIINLLSTDSNA